MGTICVDVLRASARAFRDHEAVWFRGQSLTFGQLLERSFRLANALRSLGLRPQDRVGLLAQNGLYSVEEVTGLAAGGFVRVPLHARNTPHQHRYMLEHVGARALIVAQDLYEPLAPFLPDIAGLEHVIVHGDDGPLRYHDLVDGGSDADPGVALGADDLSHIAFTSGTTGRPKAAVHTHGGLMGVTAQYTLTLPRFDDTDRYLAVAPLSHAASTLQYTAIAAGATTVVEPALKLDSLVSTLSQRPATFTMMVPTMIQSLLEWLDAGNEGLRAGLQPLRALVSTGAPLAPDLAVRVREHLGEVLHNSYGQVEGVPAAMMTPRDFTRAIAEDRQRLQSVGRSGILVRCRIVDDDGRELPPHEHGEIAIDTPGNLARYWDAPEATAAKFDSDGFVLTQDIGYLDDDGYLYVVGRKDDMIISGGFNIWPAEIEEAIAQHPDVVEVVVVGVPHPRWGETPWAAVVVSEGSTLTAEEIVDWCRERIGSMKKPTRVEVRTGLLPRSAVGKIPRRMVRDELLASAPQAERSAASASPTS